jgi:hypothetical protein
MPDKSRDELIRMVQHLIDADLPEDEEDRIVDELKSSVIDPRVTDLIYDNTPKLTAEEVVDTALAYRPIELQQGNVSARKGPERGGERWCIMPSWAGTLSG